MRQEVSEEEADPDDLENHERLEDDEFKNMDIVAKKDIEIEELKKVNKEQEKHIVDLSSKLTPKPTDEKKGVLVLPKIYQKIMFKMAGNSEILSGKVLNKHKPKSIHRDIVTVRLDDGSVNEFDFKHVSEWKDATEVEDDEQHEYNSEIFATILTKAQATKRPEFEESIRQEIKKFEDFSAFKIVDDVLIHLLEAIL